MKTPSNQAEFERLLGEYDYALRNRVRLGQDNGDGQCPAASRLLEVAKKRLIEKYMKDESAVVWKVYTMDDYVAGPFTSKAAAFKFLRFLLGDYRKRPTIKRKDGFYSWYHLSLPDERGCRGRREYMIADARHDEEFGASSVSEPLYPPSYAEKDPQ